MTVSNQRNIRNCARLPSSPSPQTEHKTTIRICTSANVVFHPPEALVQPPSRTLLALGSLPALPLLRSPPPLAHPAMHPPPDARNRTRHRSFGHRAGAPPRIVCAVCRARSIQAWFAYRAASQTWCMRRKERRILNGAGATKQTAGPTARSSSASCTENDGIRTL